MHNNSEIIFILVEPVYRGNVGAAARVINNFGFSHLRLVGAVPQKEDYYLAVHSEEIMHNIEVFDDLSSAIQDIDNVIAVTRRFGRKKKTDLDVAEIGNFTQELYRGKTAFVFGRETYGLKDEEIELCPIRCLIPTNPEFPSLNLAQAVAIVCYELFNGLNDQKPLSKLAKTEKVDKTIEQIIDSLLEIGYFENGDPRMTKKKLQNILLRSYTSDENLLFLTKMFHRISILVKSLSRCGKADKK
ncbi:MAG: TrmJ/YjtD family RNA methyltransferase [Candidatus Cloacimonetes bacterium]|nr:TrmJ/YjtD family RNA methyltransferase [Candidatus Cloacimonadota bacterium]